MGREQTNPVDIRDPVEYQRVILGRKLYGIQKEICWSVANNTATAVKGCHASGKTYLAAGLIPWWLQRWEDQALVIQISPTLRQVKTYWKEVAIACEGAKKFSGVVFPELSATGLELSKDRYAIGFSSSKGVNIQGPHAKHGLLIVDEAPGVPEDIWDAAEGMMAGGDWHRLSLGNPTVPSGEFFNDFTKNRNAVKGITISAFDSPNFAGVTHERLMQMNEDELSVAPMPFLTKRRWARDFIRKWGANHPKVLARVFGKFPPQAANAVFQLSWIEAASEPLDDEQLPPWNARSWIQVGLDVAGPGDDNTVLVARMGAVVLLCEAWNIDDARGAVIRSLMQIRSRWPNCRIIVNCDEIGIGYYFALAIADAGFETYGFDAGKEATDKVHFFNKRAEAHWALRELMERKRVRNMLSEDAQGQLSEILYFERPDGRTQIEPKDETKKRLQASPDFADAHVMAFAPIVPRQTVVDNLGADDQELF